MRPKAPGKEALSPYPFCICLLLQIYAQAQQPIPFNNTQKNTFVWSGLTLHQLSVFLFSEIESLDTHHDHDVFSTSLESLIIRIQKATETSTQNQMIIEKLLEVLNTCLSSPDALDDIITGLSNMITTTTESTSTDQQYLIERTSLFGLFLRRVSMTFSFYMFEGIVSLYDELEVYYQTYTKTIHQNSSFDVSSTSDIILHQSSLLSNTLSDTANKMMPRQLQLHLDQTAADLESGNLKYTMKELESRLQDICTRAPHLPHVHYGT